MPKDLSSEDLDHEAEELPDEEPTQLGAQAYIVDLLDGLGDGEEG